MDEAQQAYTKRELGLPADPSALGRARAFFDGAAAAAGFDGEDLYLIRMAANEAVSNAIEHGRPCSSGLVYLSAAVESEGLLFCVCDCGEFALAPDFDEIAERRLGFAFMNLVMDDVQLHTQGHTEVRLYKQLRQRRGGLA